MGTKRKGTNNDFINNDNSTNNATTTLTINTSEEIIIKQDNTNQTTPSTTTEATAAKVTRPFRPSLARTMKSYVVLTKGSKTVLLTITSNTTTKEVQYINVISMVHELLIPYVITNAKSRNVAWVDANNPDTLRNRIISTQTSGPVLKFADKNNDLHLTLRNIKATSLAPKIQEEIDNILKAWSFVGWVVKIVHTNKWDKDVQNIVLKHTNLNTLKKMVVGVTKKLIDEKRLVTTLSKDAYVKIDPSAPKSV